MNVQAKPTKLIRGATGDWEVVIGLEVHAQVTSQAKLFSGASTEFGGEPNSHVSLVWALIIGFAVWGDVPTPSLLFGSAIVVGSGIFLFWRALWDSNPCYRRERAAS